MNSILNFNDMVSKEILDINFDNIYKDIYDKNEYVPQTLITILLLTIYHLESEKRLTPDISTLLTYYIKQFQSKDPQVHKYELLYITYKLEELNRPLKKSSTDNLYI